jgi:hypothetical protein
VLLLGVYFVGFISHPILARMIGASFRFTLPLLNYLFFIAMQLIPFALFAVALRAWSGWRLFIANLIVVPLLLVAVPSGCVASACVVTRTVTLTRDESSERIRTFDAPHGRVAVYRTDGGATTAFGINVDQECTVIPGLLILSHPLLGEYPAYDVDVRSVSADGIRLAIIGAERKGLPSTLTFDVPLCRYACACPIGYPPPLEAGIPK